MMSHITPMRWLAALLLLAVLLGGTVSSVLAQESDPGSASPTPAAEVENDLSIGDEATSVIGSDDATPTDVAEDDTQASATATPTDAAGSATDVPSDGIGDDGDTDVSTGEDGTPVAEETPTETPTDEASPTETATPDETVEAASVGVSVSIYLCDSGYGGGDPAGDANCAATGGIDVSASADDTSLGTKTTGGSGSASFDAPEGSQVVFSEVQSTVPSGYVPDGNGTAYVTGESGASAYIVNIKVETAGRLQISNGQCPTSGEARTQFIVIGPLAVQSAGLGCEPRGNTTLTVSGPGGTYTAVTDGSGNWIGTLPVGTYTVSNENGSGSAEVVSGSTTIVMVVDYVPGPKGTLTIQRYDCAEGAEGTTITIDGGPNNDSCLPSDKSVSVSAASGGAAPLVIDLGEDGATSVDVAAGDYVVTDGPTGTSADVQVAEGASVTATINSTILTGSVSASMYWCGSSVSGSIDPSHLGTWANGCGRSGAGIDVSLLDGNGEVVSTASTGGNGTLSFGSVSPGRYSLSSSSGCALFANGADARNGFDLVAGETVEIAAFGCDEPANVPENPNNPDPDPGTIGGENGNSSGGGGGIGNNGNGYGGIYGGGNENVRNLTSNPLASVSTLPSTGEGANTLVDRTLLMLLALAALAAGMALSLSGHRSKRTI